MSSLTTDNSQLTTASLIVTVDTEEEGLWGGRFPRTGNSVRNVARGLPRFQEVCDRFGIRPTYLVDAAVVQDDTAVRTLREVQDDGRCEIGAHVHPWCNPPHEEEVNVRNSYLCNLPEALQREKITWLTDAISERFGMQPTSFRAGRYGLDGVGARILTELGYSVDSSVIPFSDFSSEGGPDFQDAPYKPYYVNGKHLCEPVVSCQASVASCQLSVVRGRRDQETSGSGQGPEVRGLGSGGAAPQLTTNNYQLTTSPPSLTPDTCHLTPALLELPVSVGYSRRDFHHAHSLRSWAMRSSLRRLRIVGVLDRLGIARRIKFSPEQADARSMIRLANMFLRHDAPCLVMLFHSSSLVSGGSPYVSDARSLERFYERLSGVFEYCTNDRRFTTATLGGFAPQFLCGRYPEMCEELPGVRYEGPMTNGDEKSEIRSTKFE